MYKSAVIGLTACAAVVAIFAFSNSAQGVALFQTNDWAVEQQFMRFIAEAGRTYSSKAEYEFRLAQFERTQKLVEERNMENSEVVHGINDFADWTQEEFEATLGYRQVESNQKPFVFNAEPDAEVNWVTSDKVSPVKNQGACGSCWAFASIGAIESHVAIHQFFGPPGPHGVFRWSEQELVDCVTECAGCYGGHMIPAFQFSAREDVFSEDSYKYEGRNANCRTSEHTIDEPHVKTKWFETVTAMDENEFKAAIMKGPLTVGVDATNWSSYKSGIFSSCKNRKNHAVLAVGYTSDYWLVKNSWGSRWGEEGYIRLAMGNTCGFLEDGVYPTVLHE